MKNSIRTNSIQTTCVKASDAPKKWWLIDAEGVVLGRLASEIAQLIRGKKKACFTPNMNTGDHVVVINAGKVGLTANKMKTKMHHWHTGYIGGLKSISIGERLQSVNCTNVIRDAVKGMLPKGPLGYDNIRNLHIYADQNHEQQAQQPEVYDFLSKNRKNKA